MTLPNSNHGNKKSTWRERNGILIPGRFIEGHEIELPRKPNYRGRFTMRAKKNGRVLRERTFDNLILNQGLDRLAQGSWGNYCQVGTGSATPVASNTQLSNFLVSTTVGGQGSATAHAGTLANGWVADRTVVYTFALGAVVGNLTEVGVGWSSSNGSLFSRALILDGSGVPTTFPVASDEQLEVTYVLQEYIPQADVATTQTIGSTTYDVIIRPSQANSSSYWCPRVHTDSSASMLVSTSTGTHIAYSGSKVDGFTTSTPTGTLGTSSSITNSAYTAGNYYHDGSITFGPSTANGSIKTIITTRNCCCFQIEYQTAITKTSTQTLIIPSRLSWARH